MARRIVATASVSLVLWAASSLPLLAQFETRSNSPFGGVNGDHKPDLVLLDLDALSVIAMLNTGVVTFSPTTPLNFKKQAVGKTGAPQTVKLTNTGATELKIQSMKASAEFAMKSTCGDRVAPGAKCTISATFSPTKQGAQQGTISIIDNASSKPQVIELLGTGT
jgi:hypothetical protein